MKGVRDVIAVDELFDAIPAINRSFHHVKAVSKSDNPHGDDFIEFPEFRLFLQTLRQFFEYYEAFNRYLSKVDSTGTYISKVDEPSWDEKTKIDADR